MQKLDINIKTYFPASTVHSIVCGEREVQKMNLFNANRSYMWCISVSQPSHGNGKNNCYCIEDPLPNSVRLSYGVEMITCVVKEMSLIPEDSHGSTYLLYWCGEKATTKM
jgi:hypothetical protein